LSASPARRAKPSQYHWIKPQRNLQLLCFEWRPSPANELLAFEHVGTDEEFFSKLRGIIWVDPERLPSGGLHCHGHTSLK
jgi:hypothetical protein